MVHETLNKDNKEKHADLLAEIIDSCIHNNILTDILMRERGRIMECFLSHFDADEYIDFVKREGYDEGALNKIISFFLKNYISKSIAIEESKLTEAEFDEAVRNYVS